MFLYNYITKLLPLVLVFLVLTTTVDTKNHERKKRYLLFTSDTQFGIFTTISIPLNPDSSTSVAWFFEANYYNVDNATYFNPLLGDVVDTSRTQDKRSVHEKEINFGLTRSQLYFFIETMLQKHGYPRPCLLRAICENVTSHFLHNGLLGDLLHLALTPSTSISENDIDDIYYEAEFLGWESQCGPYIDDCPENPLELISAKIEDIVTG